MTTQLEDIYDGWWAGRGQYHKVRMKPDRQGLCGRKLDLLLDHKQAPPEDKRCGQCGIALRLELRVSGPW